MACIKRLWHLDEYEQTSVSGISRVLFDASLRGGRCWLSCIQFLRCNSFCLAVRKNSRRKRNRYVAIGDGCPLSKYVQSSGFTLAFWMCFQGYGNVNLTGGNQEEETNCDLMWLRRTPLMRSLFCTWNMRHFCSICVYYWKHWSLDYQPVLCDAIFPHLEDFRWVHSNQDEWVTMIAPEKSRYLATKVRRPAKWWASKSPNFKP